MFSKIITYTALTELLGGHSQFTPIIFPSSSFFYLELHESLLHFIPSSFELHLNSIYFSFLSLFYFIGAASEKLDLKGFKF